MSLQKGLGAEQLRDVAQDWPVLDFVERLDADAAFVDTAAVLAHLDLVITSDTAVAHLAGVLGVPVWLALSVAADWRWLRGREDSPWYPTMRLFRQSAWGAWGGVFRRMADELAAVHGAVSGPVVAEIAPAELLDKIAILEIKRERIREPRSQQHIRVELGGLVAARARFVRGSPELDRLASQLKAVNEALWQIEDDIRLQEQQQDFGPRFVELARSVCHTNARRSEIKGRINALLGSRIVEEKAYAGEPRADGKGAG